MLSPLESLTLGRKCRYGNRNRGRRKIAPKELVAGLLWEITYYGGTEAMSNENQERFFNRSRNANK